jgi:hypothetical protein
VSDAIAGQSRNIKCGVDSTYTPLSKRSNVVQQSITSGRLLWRSKAEEGQVVEAIPARLEMRAFQGRLLQYECREPEDHCRILYCEKAAPVAH